MNKDLENSNVNEAQEIKLAENAFRELKPGEEYKPIMSSDIYPREATPWSGIWGIGNGNKFLGCHSLSRA